MPDFDATEHEFMQAVYPLPSCPDPDLLVAVNHGVLPADVELAIQKHLLHCGICRTLVNDLASLEEPDLTPAQHRHILSEIQVLPPRRRTRRILYACLAFVVASAIAILLLRRSRPSENAAASLASAPAAPAQINIPIARLDLPESTSGAKTGGRPTVAELAPAFAAYRQNKYQEAATDFAILAQRYPESDIVFLYLGISQLFLEENEDALASLGRAEALASPQRQDAASWYHAIAALRLQDAESKDLFAQLCSRKGSPYAGQACAIARQLKAETIF